MIDINKFSISNFGTIVQAHRIGDDDGITYLLELSALDGKLCFEYMGEAQNLESYNIKKIFSLKKDCRCVSDFCSSIASKIHGSKIYCAKHHNIIKNDIKYKVTDFLYRFNTKAEYQELLLILEEPFIENKQDETNSGFLFVKRINNEFDDGFYTEVTILKKEWIYENNSIKEVE